jgi:predicted  nucleic acid-binding Zn-ribbon protein
MTEATPQEKMKTRLNSLEWKLESLQSSARLSSMRDAVEDLDTAINGMLPRIEDFRRQGYVYGKGLEGKAQILGEQWKPIHVKVISEIQRQVPRLESDLRPLESQIAQVKGRAATPAAIESTVTRLESTLEAFEDRVSAIETSVRGMYDSFSKQVDEVKVTLNQVDEMLQQFAEATFQLLPDEGAVMAVKAVYSKDARISKEDPEGFLYLTDQRLFYEQKQEIATKKILFITTEKEKVQKLLLEVPVALVEKVVASKKGLFGNEDHLELNFKHGAPVVSAWFHLNGQDSSWWQGLIGQVRSGELTGERAVAVDPEQVRKVKSAPGKCPNCGAPVNQVVLRGMDNLTCEYCQFVMRLD